jgi:7-carboxy-7-deazaguanine synthase
MQRHLHHRAVTLPVNEIFETIQGEGQWTGTPAVFVRLQGCPVGCPWCDTKFTWEQRADREIDTAAMLSKDHSGEDTWCPLSAQAVCDLVVRYHTRHVVITGGEPAMHGLYALTTALADAGRTTQIETSGTFPLRVHLNTWVTLSPKFNMPGGLAVQAEAISRANEIKMPVGRAEDIIALIGLLDRKLHRSEAPIYLQPLSLSPKATELCVRNAIANGWRVSLQTHALAGWR